MACSFSLCIVKVRVTVNNLKILSATEKSFYGEFLSPVTIVVLLNLLRASWCSPNALLAQLKNCPFGVNTTIERGP